VAETGSMPNVLPGEIRGAAPFRSVRNRRTSHIIAAILFTVLVLTGCGSDPRPPAIAAANWSNYEVSDRDTVVNLLQSWLTEAKRVEGVFVVLDGMNMADARTPMRVTHANGWRSIPLTGQHGSWEKRTLGSKQNPVTVWVRDMIPGETTADIVICDQKLCTDVTAWYMLANFNDQLQFPDQIAGLLPQDAAGVSRLGTSDPFIVEFYLEHIDDEVTGSVISDAGIEPYTIKDRVYLRGQRDGGTGTEECVGWVDRLADLETEADRYPYFCFSTTVGVFTGTRNNTGLKNFEVIPPRTPHAPDVSADLYGNLSDDDKAVLQILGAVDSNWAKRHDR